MYIDKQTELLEKSDRRDAVAAGTIINKRDIEPLLRKAWEIIRSYEQATGSIVSILGRNGHSAQYGEHKSTIFFCSLCRRFYPNPGRQWGKDEYPCSCVHSKSIGAARRMGTYIYMCDMGFVYWISPIFSGGRFAGSLIAGRILGIERNRAVENIYRLCRGTIPENRVEKYLSGIPERTFEEIKAQAQLLLVCAKRISGRIPEKSGAPNTGEITVQTALKITPARESIPAEIPGRGHVLDRERLLLASLRRGDSKTAMKILREILRILFVPGSLDTLKLAAIELAVLLSRANPERAADPETLEANNKYLKWIGDSGTVEELTENLKAIIENTAGTIFSFHGIRHSSALRKAERFIWENYTHKISLREIAEASGLSAPYFSTIFKEEMGENLSNYLNRLRIEKAAAILTETNITLSKIACECGFADQSWFSKIFKHYMGISPGKYRESGYSYRTG
jgi:AraC-like DNA-binding protein/ligand-binding sensor protein